MRSFILAALCLAFMSETSGPCPAQAPEKSDPVDKGRQESPEKIDGWGVVEPPSGASKIALVDGDRNRLLILAMGPDQDLSIERDNVTAPRVTRPVTGDFTATVQVDGPVKPGDATVAERTGFSGAGLLLMADERNYARLERAALVRSGQRTPYVIWEVREDGGLRRFGVPMDYPEPIDEEKPFWLRVKRDGNTLHAFATQDTNEWHKLNDQPVDFPAKVAIGVAAVNVSKYPFGPVFSDLAIETSE